MNIQEEINKHLLNHNTINVIIAGITCSGKTTLASQIRNYFSNNYSVTLVSQDDYFKNLADIPRIREGYLTDSIEAFHTSEFAHDVNALLKDGVVFMPRYDIATNTRISKNKIVRVGRINVFEGLHTIHLLGNLDNCIKVFVNTDNNLCLERRIARDTLNFNVPEIRIRQYWNDCIMPMCDKYIFTQIEDADIILNRKGGEFDDSKTNL